MTKLDPNRGSGEDRLIAKYFRPLARHPGAFGLIEGHMLPTVDSHEKSHNKLTGITAPAHNRSQTALMDQSGVNRRTAPAVDGAPEISAIVPCNYTKPLTCASQEEERNT